jgi:phosphatidylserine decarboxylase
MKSLVRRLAASEDLNFLITNRIPRISLTLAVGWLSRIRHPWVARSCIAIWRLFTDLDLSDSKEKRFDSLHACFTRELIPGARAIDHRPDIICSPCDGIVGACGEVEKDLLLQAKGQPYRLGELFGPSQDPADFINGTYVTLRLTSAMYHRFHAPHDCEVEHVTYLSGDTWNVNPIALARVERLFCRNERAVIRLRVGQDRIPVALVPVAAILVASLRLSFIDVRLHLRYRGPNEIPCEAPLVKGEQMGWFEHGSTIIVFAPAGVRLAAHIQSGARVKMGEPLLELPANPNR